MPEQTEPLQVGNIVQIRYDPRGSHLFADNSVGVIRYISPNCTLPYSVDLLHGNIRYNSAHTCDGHAIIGQWVSADFLTRLSYSEVTPPVTACADEPVEEEISRCSDCDEPETECTCERCTYCEEFEANCRCTTCAHCGEPFRHPRGCVSCEFCQECIDNGRVDHYTCNCGNCHNGEAASCSNCGDYECCATFRCEEDTCRLCTECCTCESASEFIRSYSCRDYPDAKPSPRTVPSTFLYLGVEVETEADEDDSLRDIAETIYNKHSDEILMKEDGSLDHGIELVTGRYSLDAHKTLWPNLCETVLSTGLRSWKHKSTGLHVHMSRKFFTPLDIGKLLVFVNSDNETIRKNIRRIAGRAENHYCKVAKKKLTDVYHSDERYEAVNLTNDKTIEIRIFKGTLNANHIISNIEFCHAMAHWVKNTSTQDIESWHSFWSYVLKHKKDYKQLIEFLCPTQQTMAVSLPSEETTETA